MTDLLIGFGEVGASLYEVLSERRSFYIVDPAKGYEPELGEDMVDWAHVAIPYSESFISTIVEYVRRFNPNHLVIHSTVPIGTTRKIEREADYIPTYFSPIRGRHPNLARYIREFSKWFASSIAGQMDNDFVTYFAAAGIQTRKAPSYEFLEWAKLWETTSYGYNLVMWQEIERQVTKIPGDKNANLSALKNWLHEKKQVYDGDLGYVPIYDLVPGPIGGHCILPNVELLKERMTPELYAWLTTSNEMRKP